MRLCSYLCVITLGIISCGLASAQSEPAPLRLEVASVRPGAPHVSGETIGAMRGGPGTDTPERITYRLVTLQQLLRTAYNLRSFQISGPSWLNTQQYDIVANVPPGTTKDQLKVMMQNLLAERFNLAFHRETKVFPSYELSIASGGPKLTSSGEVRSLGFTPTGEPSQAVLRKGVMVSSPVNGGIRLAAALSPISQLATFLEFQLDNFEVVNKTGLTGEYNISMDFAPTSANQRAAAMKASGVTNELDLAFPPLEAALRDQLGLKLVKSSSPYDVLVLDHVDKTPSDN